MVRWIINLMIISMIFFPEKVLYELPKDYGFVSQEVILETSDQIRLHGWFLQAEQEKAALLFFHGNAGNISHRLYKVKGWVDAGISVFLVDYRGYGKSEGKIEHGEDLMRDAEAAFRWLTETREVPSQKIILYGESLGTHFAVRLAAGDSRVAALVLEAPYTSFTELAKRHYGAIPGVSFLVKDFSFPNEEWITKIKTPLFILHGTRDEICPYDMGEKLFEEAPEPKAFFTIEGGAHNDLPSAAGADYWTKPIQFVSKYL